MPLKETTERSPTPVENGTSKLASLIECPFDGIQPLGKSQVKLLITCCWFSSLDRD